MINIRVQRANINWPPHCAKCLELPQETIVASCMIISKTMPFFSFIPIDGYYVRVRYPVCLRHAKFARLNAFITNRNPLNLVILTMWAFVLVMSVGFAIALSPSTGTTGDSEFFSLLASISLAMLFIYFQARRRVPVRIVGVDEHFMTIAFRNSKYADLFRQENRK